MQEAPCLQCLAKCKSQMGYFAILALFLRMVLLIYIFNYHKNFDFLKLKSNCGVKRVRRIHKVARSYLTKLFLDLKQSLKK